MIASFLDSWSLFHDVYVAGWLVSVLLALVGVLVVARDQIFIGAAVSQSSLLGIAVGLRLEAYAAHERLGPPLSDALHTALGGVFAVLGALVTVRSESPGTESREAVTGWVFLVGASLSVLIVAHSPMGLAEVHRLLASTILGATALDVALFAIMLAATIGVLVAWRDSILLMVMDTEMARAVGLRVTLWERLLAVWLGISVAAAIHVSGLVYTFGYLVLPGLVAKNVCREVRTMLLVAPAVGLVNALAAFVLANHYDYPPGQLATAMLATLLAGAWGARRARR